MGSMARQWYIYGYVVYIWYKYGCSPLRADTDQTSTKVCMDGDFMYE